MGSVLTHTTAGLSHLTHLNSEANPRSLRLTRMGFLVIVDPVAWDTPSDIPRYISTVSEGIIPDNTVQFFPVAVVV